MLASLDVPGRSWEETAASSSSGLAVVSELAINQEVPNLSMHSVNNGRAHNTPSA
jgi:hypothetical protein